MINNLEQELNPMQQEAVKHIKGALLLIAGAGSGKTRVLIHRMAHIIGSGVDAYNILAITFTNKAAKEMKQRAAKLMPQGEDIWVSTFHSFCVSILRREIDVLGYTNNFTIYDTDDSSKLLKEIYQDFNIDETSFKANYVLFEISKQKNELVTPEIYASIMADDYRKEIISNLYGEYQKRLKKYNAVDFDDIILKVIELFGSYPDILEKYSKRFQYIMVDEYQDTNTAQYQLIRFLASYHENLCVVGDDDQSIYGWRGANIRNILDFEKDFTDAKVIKLEQNYRSTGKILNAANKIIENNTSRKGKNLWTNEAPGESIRYFEAENDTYEAKYISEKIIEEVKNNSNYNNFVVLYRMNFQSRLIEEQFVMQNIPYRIFGGLRFYDRAEIKDILAYLKYIINTNDQLSLKRIINTPKRGIGPATIDKIAQLALSKNISFYDSLKSADNLSTVVKRKCADFCTLIEKLNEASKNMPISEFVKQILEQTGLLEAVRLNDIANNLDKESNIHEFVSRAIEFENKMKLQNEEATVRSFVEEVSLVADIDSLKESENYVSLMTIHSAKGLEFPNVFLSGLEENTFPTTRSMTGNPSDMEEERRLCYVAITRAENMLYISSCRKRLKNGEVKYYKPSRFFDEIPDELIEHENIMTSKGKIENKSYANNSPRKVKLKTEIEETAMRPNFGKKWDISKIKTNHQNET